MNINMRWFFWLIAISKRVNSIQVAIHGANSNEKRNSLSEDVNHNQSICYINSLYSMRYYILNSKSESDESDSLVVLSDDLVPSKKQEPLNNSHPIVVSAREKISTTGMVEQPDDDIFETNMFSELEQMSPQEKSSYKYRATYQFYERISRPNQHDIGDNTGQFSERSASYKSKLSSTHTMPHGVDKIEHSSARDEIDITLHSKQSDSTIERSYSHSIYQERNYSYSDTNKSNNQPYQNRSNMTKKQVGYLPAQSKPSYQSAQSKPSYQPAQSRPNYQPAQSRPSYQPAQSRPNYQPAQSRPSYQPAQSRPNYQPAQSRPNYQPAQSKPSYQSALSKPSYQPAQSKPSYQPAQSRPSYQPAQSRPNYQPAQSRPSYQPAQSKPSYQSAQSKPSYQSALSKPSYQSAQSKPSYQPAQSRPSYQPAQSRPNYQPAQSRPSYQPAQSKPSYQSAQSRPNYKPKLYNQLNRNQLSYKSNKSSLGVPRYQKLNRPNFNISKAGSEPNYKFNSYRKNNNQNTINIGVSRTQQNQRKWQYNYKQNQNKFNKNKYNYKQNQNKFNKNRYNYKQNQTKFNKNRYNYKQNQTKFNKNEFNRQKVKYYGKLHNKYNYRNANINKIQLHRNILILRARANNIKASHRLNHLKTNVSKTTHAVKRYRRRQPNLNAKELIQFKKMKILYSSFLRRHKMKPINKLITSIRKHTPIVLGGVRVYSSLRHGGCKYRRKLYDRKSY